jgi:MSHA biogenesis protein MshE
MQGKGCSQCMDTGYSGRIGVFEMIVIDEQLKIDLNREDIESFERHANAQDRFSSVLNEAMELALSGVTSIEEVMRVTDGLISSIHLVEENS